jgi:hypothetical protein
VECETRTFFSFSRGTSSRGTSSRGTSTSQQSITAVPTKQDHHRRTRCESFDYFESGFFEKPATSVTLSSLQTSEVAQHPPSVSGPSSHSPRLFGSAQRRSANLASHAFKQLELKRHNKNRCRTFA